VYSRAPRRTTRFARMRARYANFYLYNYNRAFLHRRTETGWRRAFIVRANDPSGRSVLLIPRCHDIIRGRRMHCLLRRVAIFHRVQCDDLRLCATIEFPPFPAENNLSVGSAATGRTEDEYWRWRLRTSECRSSTDRNSTLQGGRTPRAQFQLDSAFHWNVHYPMKFLTADKPCRAASAPRGRGGWRNCGGINWVEGETLIILDDWNLFCSPHKVKDLVQFVRLKVV
jgi:hypothetical protein